MMADERLVQGLAAWLRDSEVPAPDGRMSASRVIAGIETTPQLGRLWPPARLAPKAKPAPALGAFGPEGPPPRPVPRVQKPQIKARLRAAVTPIRSLAMGSVVALVLGGGLIMASILPDGGSSEPAPALAVASPRPAAFVPVATSAPTAAPQPKPELPPSWAVSDRALDWQTDSVRLEAATVDLAIGDRTFSAPRDVRVTGALAAVRTSLDGGWFERGVEQRLVIEITRDERDWWVARIRTYDGRKNGGWIDFKGLAALTRTPLGEAWTGDLSADSSGAERKAYRRRGSATLTIDELRLSAFGPEGALAERSSEVADAEG